MRERTRNDLLEAGLRLLMSEPAAAFSHLTVARIAAEASTHREFFHHWNNRDEYFHDLVAVIVEQGKSLQFEVFEQTVIDRLADGEDLASSLVAGAAAGLQSNVDDPRIVLEMLLWSRAARDVPTRDQLAQLNHQLDNANAAVVEELLTLTGRTLRAPFTAVSIAALIGAITQGLTLRYVIDPDVPPQDAIGWVLLNLVPMLTTTPGDTRTPLQAAPSIDAPAFNETGGNRPAPPPESDK